MLRCCNPSQNLFSDYLRALVRKCFCTCCVSVVLVQCTEAKATLGLGGLIAQTQYFGLGASCQEDLD